MIIRNAVINDLEELLYIYNYEVKNGTATLDITEQTYEQRKEWFNAHGTNRNPLIVAEEDGKVIGYATLSPYRNKEAYSTTVELSVYVHPDHRHKGVANALVEKIITLAKEEPTIKLIISVITTGNTASINLHKKFGFTFCSGIPRVAYKNGIAVGIDNYILDV